MGKMASGEMYPTEFLDECFELDAERRVYRWRQRPVSHFKSERAAKAWNTAFAGRPAGLKDRYGRNIVCLTYRGVERQLGLDTIAAALGDTASLAYGMPRAQGVTADEMAERYDAIAAIVEEIQPCTVRQCFYQCVVKGVVEKTEAAYDKVQRALVALRREERIPYAWVHDSTRVTYRPRTFSSVSDALTETARRYRKALWDDVDATVEVWLEKDALSDVVYPVTSEFDVALRVARGFSSLSFMADAAEDMEALGKDVYVYHLGDHDPSGRAAGEAIERDLKALAPSVAIYFERIAVTVEQIADLRLPTRPTKRSDSRAASFEAEFGLGSVELDAIHPETLRRIVHDSIELHIGDDERQALRASEQDGRRMLERFAAQAKRRRRAP
jgi:hypothetical protein